MNTRNMTFVEIQKKIDDAQSKLQVLDSLLRQLRTINADEKVINIVLKEIRIATMTNAQQFTNMRDTEYKETYDTLVNVAQQNKDNDKAWALTDSDLI